MKTKERKQLLEYIRYHLAMILLQDCQIYKKAGSNLSALISGAQKEVSKFKIEQDGKLYMPLAHMRDTITKLGVAICQCESVEQLEMLQSMFVQAVSGGVIVVDKDSFNALDAQFNSQNKS